MRWLYLFLAIAFEVVGTMALKYSDGFKKLIPSLVVLVGYGASFYLFSLVLKYIPLGVAYAIWGGVGIILISLIGFFVFKQRFDLPGLIGIVLIVAGTLVLNLFSKMTVH